MWSKTKLSNEKSRYSSWGYHWIEFNCWKRTINHHSSHLQWWSSDLHRYENWSSWWSRWMDIEIKSKFVRRRLITLNIFISFLFRKDFFINVQRNISVSIRQSKYIIDIVWDHVNKIDYRKNSNNIISLILPDRREKHWIRLIWFFLLVFKKIISTVYNWRRRNVYAQTWICLDTPLPQPPASYFETVFEPPIVFPQPVFA